MHISCLVSGKSVHEFAPHPPVMQLSYLYLGKAQSQHPEMQEMTTPGKSFSSSWGLTSMLPCCDFRDMSKISFLVAQSCSHSSLIQSSPTEENPPCQPKQAAAREGQEALQGCIPVARVRRATSQAVLQQTFPKLSLGKALESTACSPMQCSETSWQRETQFST